MKKRFANANNSMKSAKVQCIAERNCLLIHIVPFLERWVIQKQRAGLQVVKRRGTTKKPLRRKKTVKEEAE